MEWKKASSGLTRRLTWKRGEIPAVVYEVEPGFVAGARLSSSPAGVRRMAMAELAPGLLHPSATQMNIHAAAELGRSLGNMRAILGNGGRWGLLIPDAVTCVRILRFESLPEKPAELETLLRWRIRETLGFPAEQARLAYQINQQGADGVELVVVAVKEDVLAQYEAALDPHQRERASLILPVTMPLLALLPEPGAAGQILTHVYSGCVTHAIVEGNRLRFWRSRLLGQGEPGLVDEVLSEAARAVASARDRLGIEIGRAWHCIRATEGGDILSQSLSSVLGRKPEVLPLSPGLDALLSAGEKRLFQPFGAPLAAIITKTANGAAS